VSGPPLIRGGHEANKDIDRFIGKTLRLFLNAGGLERSHNNVWVDRNQMHMTAKNMCDKHTCQCNTRVCNTPIQY
jgi:hypothetical protein